MSRKVRLSKEMILCFLVGVLFGCASSTPPKNTYAPPEEKKSLVDEKYSLSADHAEVSPAQKMEQDAGLFIPVGVERDAPLLHEHAAEMFFGVKCESGEVAFHSWFPLVCVSLNRHLQVA